MGCTSAIVFTCFGAAYGTAKSGVGISAMGVLRPDLIVKSMFKLMFITVMERIWRKEGVADWSCQILCLSLWLVSLVFTG